MRRAPLLAAASVTIGLALLGAQAEAAPLRRFAILAANDDGGPGTAPLRYAQSDAKKMQAILRELGGYRDEDVVTLLGRPADELLAAVARVEVRLAEAKRAGAHTTLLLYYSGHGKAGDLRLGRSTVAMSVLRQRLASSSADIKLGIIDACESGTITREKGGRRGPSFLVDSDDRELGRGLVLIASSSSDEASQESDELGGSFFTHYLASGLRGDADESGDRRVTLGEVYAYTYHRTVSVTANTRSGTQHPTYSYDLKGNGDLVLTDLTQGTSGVAFGAALAGDFLVFDVKHDEVAAELRKEPGTPRRIALPPGDYVLKKRLADHLRMKRFQLASNQYWEVEESAMARVEFEDDYAKGAVDLARWRERTRLGLHGGLVFQSFFSGAARRELFPAVGLLGAGVAFGPVLGGTLGVEVMFGGKGGEVLALGGLAVPYDFSELVVATELLFGVELGAFTFAAGPRLAGMYMRRQFPADPVLALHPQDLFTLSPAVAGEVSFFPGDDRDLSLELTARAGYFPFSVDENRALAYGELGLVLGYRL